MLVLIADSICGGFGQRDKKSFVHLAAEELNLQVWDESSTGMSTGDYLYHYDTGHKLCPEQQRPLSCLEKVSIVVIALGNVDGKKVFINKNILGRIVPLRYRKEKIDPRPYFSYRRWKRLLEKVDNLFRLFIRQYALITGNLDYATAYEQTVDNLDEIIKIFNSKKIIIISTSVAKDLYFPGAEKKFSKINGYLRGKAGGNITFFDLKEIIKENYLLDDRFHLNSTGHDAIKKDFKCLLSERLNS